MAARQAVLQARCSKAEKAALRDTSVLFRKTDVGVGAGLRRPSALDHL